MKFKKIFAVFAAVFLVSTVFSSSFVLALSFGSSSTTSVRQGPRPSFETHYSQEQRNTYWPVLGNEETCESRQDLMLQVPPAGCQPPVVRSDLLAEQDVPVFCQVDAVNINPLIDISQINNMRFTGQYPPEVAGSGFHPARAALRTHDILLGSPLVNNVGYVVLVLKRQPDESKLPDFVNVTLTAEVDYVSGNAYGIGRSEFILEPVSDANWAKEKLKQSFWNGRYFLRLENSDENFADVSVYQGDRKVITTRVNKGETSRKIYVPGMYCRAGLQISYDSYVAAEKKARIEVSSGNDVDSFDVYEGSSFLDNRCSISKININEDGETGKVSGSCKGKEFELVLKSTNLTGSGDGIVVDNKEFVVKEDKGEYKVEINVSEEDRKGSYVLDKNNSLFKTDGEWKLIFDFSGNYGESVKEKDMDWFSQIYQKLILFKQSQTEDFVGNATQGMQYFDAAIDSYEEVADSYSGEGEGAYGKEALVKAITLARLFGKDQTRTRLINKYLEIYPDGENVQSYLPELTRARDFDTSLAGEAIEFDDKARVIRLVSLDEPTKTASAEFSVEGKGTIIKKGETNSLMEGTEKRGEIKLDDVKTDRVEVSAYCMINGQNGSKVLSTTRKRYTLKDGEPVKDGICGLSVVLDDVNLESVAKIKLTPFAEGTKTETNLTVGVGIEKRAIKLTPNKVRDKIEELNKTIAKWEKITDKLGKVVSGMKGACFATAAVLTFKNFMTGLSGEALARQEVMNGDNGWRNRCKDMVANGEKGYATMDHCVTGEAGLIDAEVAKTTAGLNSVNGKIDQIQNNPEYITDSGIFGKSVDTEKVRLALAEEAKKSCQGVGTINMGSKNWRNADGSEVKDVSVSELLVQGNVENGLITTDALRSVMLNCELKKQGLTSGHQKNVDSRLMNIAENVNGQMVVNWEFEKAKEWEKQGYPSPSYVGGATQTEKAMTIIPITQKIRGETGFVNVTHIAVVSAAPATEKLGEGEAARFGGSYVLGLTGDSQRGIYNVKDVSKMGVVGSVGENNVSDFTTAYGIGNIRAVDRLTYRNKIVDSDKLCRYFENEPYRGMPAVVPFDNTNGWYAATRQNLPTFGGIGAFDASGRVTSFWLCNVGENGRIEFNTGYGDDLCQQVNLNTGQTLEMFPGLDQSKARDLILRAQRAIEDAARQYGNQYITVAGEQCKVGSPEVGIPGTACWEFMSPKDCHLLFNVCDP
ncbi:MAG: hypothetical protein KJ858_01160, partial [Nanoarchaeota archaeon]|nr:hypothetical protein [Nanoarchaeota archaeon]